MEIMSFRSKMSYVVSGVLEMGLRRYGNNQKIIEELAHCFAQVVQNSL